MFCLEDHHNRQHQQHHRRPCPAATSRMVGRVGSTFLAKGAGVADQPSSSVATQDESLLAISLNQLPSLPTTRRGATVLGNGRASSGLERRKRALNVTMVRSWLGKSTKVDHSERFGRASDDLHDPWIPATIAKLQCNVGGFADLSLVSLGSRRLLKFPTTPDLGCAAQSGSRETRPAGIRPRKLSDSQIVKIAYQSQSVRVVDQRGLLTPTDWLTRRCKESGDGGHSPGVTRVRRPQL